MAVKEVGVLVLFFVADAIYMVLVSAKWSYIDQDFISLELNTIVYRDQRDTNFRGVI
jgi:hypothetical protein